MAIIEGKSLEFYRRVIFGDKYNTANSSQNEYVFEWCFYNAWSDMARHTLSWNNVSDKDKIRIKEDIFTNIFIKYFNGNWINFNNTDIRNIIIDFEGEMCKYYDAKLKVKVFNNFTCGQAQKVVNMFFKYLYTFKEELQLNNCAVFSQCDCPVDSINLERIYKDCKKLGLSQIVKNKNYFGAYNTNKKGTSWSDLKNMQQYVDIQNKIDEIISEYKKQKNKIYNNRLDYEFDWR